MVGWDVWSDDVQLSTTAADLAEQTFVNQIETDDPPLLTWTRVPKYPHECQILATR